MNQDPFHTIKEMAEIMGCAEVDVRRITLRHRIKPDENPKSDDDGVKRFGQEKFKKIQTIYETDEEGYYLVQQFADALFSGKETLQEIFRGLGDQKQRKLTDQRGAVNCFLAAVEKDPLTSLGKLPDGQLMILQKILDRFYVEGE